MTMLTLRNIPEKLIERLEARAERGNRTLEEEVILLLGDAVFSEDDPTHQSLGDQLQAFIADHPGDVESENEPFGDLRDSSPGRGITW